MNIRNATVDDIIPMQHCNLLCLRENYKIKYYMFILLSWPEINFLAENDAGACVGYVLGKMGDDKESQIGFITSLAVNRRYRRIGLARKLMDLSIQAMVDCFQAHSVMLHVRVTNYPALNLYRSLGFVVKFIEPKYYADGENAYTMRKILCSDVNGAHDEKKQDKDNSIYQLTVKAKKQCKGIRA